MTLMEIYHFSEFTTDARTNKNIKIDSEIRMASDARQCVWLARYVMRENMADCPLPLPISNWMTAKQQIWKTILVWVRARAPIVAGN